MFTCFFCVTFSFQYGIPLSGSDVEDLMVSLDQNSDEVLDFKEVAHGLEALKKERRANKRQESMLQKWTVTQPSPLSKISRESGCSLWERGWEGRGRER